MKKHFIFLFNFIAVILPCERDSVKLVAEYVKSEPVVVPTDTLYGLAISIFGDIKKVYALKNRDLSKKVPVGVANSYQIQKIAQINENALTLIKKFMPGPLTIVLPSRIPEITGPTVGVRIPNHFVPRYLAELSGPITLTSANISGDKNPVKVEDTMDINVKYRIDCGTLSGKPSTIVSLVDEVKLIREGAIPFSVILNALRR